MQVVNDMIKQRSFLEKIVYKILDLVRLRSDEAEISITKTTGITVSTRYNKLENVEFHSNKVLNITVFCKKRKGNAISNDLSEKSITNAINIALDIANYTSPDIYSGIAEKELLAFNIADLDLFHPISLNTELGIKLATQSEQSALNYDKHIVSTEGGKFYGYFTTKVFGNSHGMLQSYHSSQYSLCCSVIAKNNDIMEQNYAYTLGRSFDDLRSPEWVGIECAKRTLERLNAQKIKTITCPVIFNAEVATTLFNHLAQSICGDNVYRKSTFLLNDIEKKIFPNWISIKECPHILKGLGSAPFDSEGVQTMDRMIVKNGILNNWILNSYSARKIGLINTGNADGIYNWCISYNDISFEKLIQTMYRGVIITDIMGQGVNIITGDYSRGISGFWVENGVIQHPIHEITVAGNLRKMFQNIIAISNDIEMRSNIRCGSVLISSMKIAGI